MLKIAVDWKPTNTKELIEKNYNVTQIHFMDYRSSLHSHGNYKLCETERIYQTTEFGGVMMSWKKGSFGIFLKDVKRPEKQKYISSEDEKFKVINKAKGTAKKPCQRKRPASERIPRK